MFKSLGALVVRRPWWTILAWVIAVGLSVALAPKVEISQEQSDFLPSKYESVKAIEVQQDAFPQEEGQSATVVATRSDGKKLTESDTKVLNDLAKSITDKKIEKVTSVEVEDASPNEKVQTILVKTEIEGWGGGEDAKEIVEELRHEVKNADTGDLTVRVTGAVAFGVDSMEAFEKGDQITIMATVLVILVLLLLTFRSIIGALLPLFAIFAFITTTAGGLISTVQKVFDLKAEQMTQSMLMIVLLGVGTDYILFLLFRYREQLRAGVDRKQAMVNAVERVGEVVASAAGAVIIAFAALLLAQLGMLKSMGPAMAIGVFTAALASLTLIPAIVSLIGPKVFWPSKSWREEPKHTTSAKIGGLIGRKPLMVAVVSGLLLIVAATGIFSHKTSFEMGSAPKDSESYKGLQDMKKGFAEGALDATTIVLRSTDGHKLSDDEVNAFADSLDGVNGVGTVRAYDPEFNLSEDGTVAQLTVDLDSNPQSAKAMEAIDKDIRPATDENAPEGTEALVTGTTAVFVDLQDSMVRDYKVVFPVAGVLIAIILGLLLRSIVAPLYLLAAVVLSFVATIGAAVFIFQNLMGHPGLLFFMPLVVYLFVVALGTDYNILAIARLREEARAGKSPKEAAAIAFTHTGPTIASAGLILAGSFATFLLAKDDGMQEMGVTTAVGIALSAFVMSMFLVPAVTRLLGHAAWWPGHQDAPAKAAPEEPERELASTDAK